ncbi:MAG: hypothetical protein GXP30_00035 [Verrucomicrobia bacterium]|nr:hypothetical protein [Verrucomicrobiota bacterium]
MKLFPIQSLPLIITFSLLFTALPPAYTEEQTPANGDDWLTFYYRDPRPDQVVAQLKAWSAEGTLQNKTARAPLTGFLSQVFRQNADKIENWYSQIKDLPKGDLELITLAMWISGSKESRELLKTHRSGFFDNKTPPDILTLNLDSASALDLLWGYYFATGDSKALRRIVAMFKYADAPKKVNGIPEDRAPLYTVLPDAAKWSLSSNAEQHSKVLKDCKDMLSNGDLNATEKKWLDESLQEAEKALKKP